MRYLNALQHILKSPYLLALSACLLWSTNFSLAKDLSISIPAITISFWRWSIACLFFFIFFRKKIKKNYPHFQQNKKKYIFLAAIGISIFNTLIYLSANFTSSNNISLITATAPIMIILISCIYKIEKITYYKSFAILVSAFASIILLTKGNINHIFSYTYNYGDLIALMAALCWAVFNVSLKSFKEDICIFSLLFYITLIGSIIILPFYLAELIIKPFNPFKWQYFVYFIYLGTTVSFIAFIFWTYAIKQIGAIRAATIYYTIPFFTAINSNILLGEKLYKYHYISFSFLLAGISILFFKQFLNEKLSLTKETTSKN